MGLKFTEAKDLGKNAGPTGVLNTHIHYYTTTTSTSIYQLTSQLAKVNESVDPCRSLSATCSEGWSQKTFSVPAYFRGSPVDTDHAEIRL